MPGRSHRAREAGCRDGVEKRLTGCGTAAESAWVSLGLASKVTIGCLVRAEQIEVVAGLGCPGAQEADGTPALCPAMAVSAGDGVGWSWCPSSCHGHSLGTGSPSTMPAGGWLLCTSTALPACLCVCVPLCTRVHLCTCVCACASVRTQLLLCIRVCRVALCIHVHACAHVHLPCASVWPLRQCLLPGLVWGSALGTALQRQRRQLPPDPFQMWLLEAQLCAASSPRAP